MVQLRDDGAHVLAHGYAAAVTLTTTMIIIIIRYTGSFVLLSFDMLYFIIFTKPMSRAYRYIVSILQSPSPCYCCRLFTTGIPTRLCSPSVSTQIPYHQCHRSHIIIIILIVNYLHGILPPPPSST